jgi:hypothetical protein
MKNLSNLFKVSMIERRSLEKVSGTMRGKFCNLFKVSMLEPRNLEKVAIKVEQR